MGKTRKLNGNHEPPKRPTNLDEEGNSVGGGRNFKKKTVENFSKRFWTDLHHWKRRFRGGLGLPIHWEPLGSSDQEDEEEGDGEQELGRPYPCRKRRTCHRQHELGGRSVIFLLSNLYK